MSGHIDNTTAIKEYWAFEVYGHLTVREGNGTAGKWLEHLYLSPLNPSRFQPDGWPDGWWSYDAAVFLAEHLSEEFLRWKTMHRMNLL